MSDVGATDHGQGAPGFVFRYNTFDLSNTSGGYLFTIHGLQSMAVTAGYTAPSGCGYPDATPSPVGSCDETVAASAQWSTVKSEYYGNKVIHAASLNLYMAHRGSWLMMFFNDVAATGSAPSILYDQYSCDSSQSPSTPAYSQHVQNSYIFDNLYNSTNVAMTKGLDFCGDMSIGKPYTITQNVDYWNQNASFNGTTGVGLGTLANKPTTCTIGVGYWATNQSTSNLSGLVGANPATPLSGTFYKCTSTNTWTSYYSPYTYPHPLRAESEAVLPQITAFVIPSTASSLMVAISTFTATDDTGVTGYLVNESATTPSINDAGWSGSAQTQYTFSSNGSKTLYAWAKDAAGNISASLSDTVTIGGSVGGGNGLCCAAIIPTPTPSPSPTPPVNTNLAFSDIKLVFEGSTYFVIKDNQRYGVTNPGVLYSYGLEFKDGRPQTSAENLLPFPETLKPGDGSLVKKPDEATVYLIFDNAKHGFVSEQIFRSLGYSFSNVLEVTTNELDSLPLGSILDNSSTAHPTGTCINLDGTVYRIFQGIRYGIPNMEVFNSLNPDNDFRYVVPANAQDRLLPEGEVLKRRVIN
jgi:hypothetical protein